MTEFKRLLDLKKTLDRKSAFLFGPRSCGKTFLYRTSLAPSRIYNLLDAKVYARLVSRPGLIYEECKSSNEVIVIDEVQKAPNILDEVHRTIEEKGATFLLTGSNARKLKRANANLLGGRATRLELVPLVSAEIPDFDLLHYLNHGGIPRHYLARPNHIADELEDYVALYLKEEIKEEAVTRNLEAFARFLEVMALHSGDELAIESFASDCQVKASTFRNYLQVLEDTLIGFSVDAYQKTVKRKAITRSKFYLFDVAVTNYLANRMPVLPKSDAYGRAFEHWVALELRAYLKLRKPRLSLSYWRSVTQMEVDFVVGDDLAIEVKASQLVTERDLKGLRALREENLGHRLIVVSNDTGSRTIDGIEILPWDAFSRALWGGKLL
jgi:predicted AAA+ superfamily ATPase